MFSSLKAVKFFKESDENSNLSINTMPLHPLGINAGDIELIIFVAWTKFVTLYDGSISWISASLRLISVNDGVPSSLSRPNMYTLRESSWLLIEKGPILRSVVMFEPYPLGPKYLVATRGVSLFFCPLMPMYKISDTGERGISINIFSIDI